MKSLPLVPKQTVVFFPSKVKVKTSPYYRGNVMSLPMRTTDVSYLCSATEEELVRVNAVCDGTSDERNPVENDRRFCRVLEQKLIEDVQNNGKYEERREH